uniref:Uncharacterized protein n=1 Tax=Desertifilum tharense IPPAS B-1220 TaxID=1781255 RepID=A0ACD5GN26_9CYAN
MKGGMAIALSQEEYWSLFAEEETIDLAAGETVQPYPEELGCGSVREIRLRDGLQLAIANYHLHEPLTLHCPEREHPLEYSFFSPAASEIVPLSRRQDNTRYMVAV